MTDLPQKLRDLADTLDGCEWNHPLGSADACRQAAEEIERRAAAFTSLRQLCDSYAADVGRLTAELEKSRTKLCPHDAAAEWAKRAGGD